MGNERDEDLGALDTEQRNPATIDIDARPTLEILELISGEDARAVEAVRRELSSIAEAVDRVVEALGSGGRLFYFGAGTSGRLGVLDASECPPTFGVPPELVQGVIAGGDKALRRSAEAREDDANHGAADVRAVSIGASDVVVGLSASGRTPYVLGALSEARGRGATMIGIACNAGSPMEPLVDVMITPLTGPEVIAGSTRMKAGTAQKLVLNMLSTTAMIRLGKVYSNLMVDLQPGSAKLRDRAERIVVELTGVDRATAQATLTETGYRVKLALIMLLGHVNLEEAEERLARAGGRVRQALASAS